jgi:hypothetical protein
MWIGESSKAPSRRIFEAVTTTTECGRERISKRRDSEIGGFAGAGSISGSAGGSEVWSGGRGSIRGLGFPGAVKTRRTDFRERVVWSDR